MAVPRHRINAAPMAAEAPTNPQRRNTHDGKATTEHWLSVVARTIARLIKRPVVALCLSIQQMWKDYRDGRTMRLQEPQSQQSRPREVVESWIRQGEGCRVSGDEGPALDAYAGYLATETMAAAAAAPEGRSYADI
ncbi:hypothetical protein O1611_g206 [Lasiodiplodia mahajangana]|uniref:Uncharacterized protein n=1 Tax=Lasiodiplodia mahajangana TaxID=1108764 RepID=A0ACC2K0Z5_9PEZI|nr:hypothetical protein O1611_g206 [Lasiodiplodia mahajangana]